MDYDIDKILFYWSLLKDFNTQKNVLKKEYIEELNQKYWEGFCKMCTYIFLDQKREKLNNSIMLIRWIIDWIITSFILTWRDKEDIYYDIHTQENIKTSLINSIKRSEKKLEKLLDLLIDSKIDDTAYNSKKEIITREIVAYQENLKKYENRSLEIFEKTEDIFHFITLAKERFQNGDLREKKEILSKLGRNFVLFDGKLALDMHSWFSPLQKHLPRIRKEYSAWELTKKGSSKWILDPNSSLICNWSGGPGLNWHTQGLKP